MESRADVALEARIEKAQYDEASLIEIRVPLNAPYLSDNSTAFERYDGQLELNGVHYQYVKRKVVDGELVLLCLPNKGKNEVQNSRDEFFKLVNDLNHSQNKGKSDVSAFKSLTTEYKKENNSWTLAVLSAVQSKPSVPNLSYVAPGYTLHPEHPPKA